MVSGPQGRILQLLSTYSPSLETAWDVPRDICLPGLAEFIGVVRSALHQPINDLLEKGLITERKTHVIGGGSRRRKVYHITEEGRKACSEIVIPDRKVEVGELFGNPPPPTQITGRDNLVNALLDAKKVILTGLPGIGKTAILRALADAMVANGKQVRFARMESFKDITAIFEEWEIGFTSESAALNSSKGDVLILDELQELSQRHSGRIEEFAGKAERLIIASRAPLPFQEGFEILEVPPLEVEDAAKLLPDHLENRELVAERLGGHPLALQLHDEGADLPESSADIQEWVEAVVLAGLGEEIVALDELALLPVPVPAEHLLHEEMLGELDDHALLRWHMNGVELHHLVRNVRSTMLGTEHHAAAAEHWSQKKGDLARLVEMHHILESDGDIESHLIANAEALMIRSNAGLATLIGDALARTPTPKLHRLAAIVAIERGEADIAAAHLEECDSPDLMFSLGLLEGKIEEFSPDDSDATFIISEATRRLDDRLPDEQPNDGVEELLEEIDMSEVTPEMRRLMLVAIAHIRHALAIVKSDTKSARKIRENLRALSHDEDPQILALELRAEIAETQITSPSFKRLIERVFAMDGLRAIMLQLAIIERVEEGDAKNLIERVMLPDIESQANLSSARRIAAKIWYWRSRLGTHNSFSSLAEAIALWKQSMCPRAAASAAELMHKML